MYIGPWQEMKLAQLVSRKADNPDNSILIDAQYKNVRQLLQFPSQNQAFYQVLDHERPTHFKERKILNTKRDDRKHNLSSLYRQCLQNESFSNDRGIDSFPSRHRFRRNAAGFSHSLNTTRKFPSEQWSSRLNETTSNREIEHNTPHDFHKRRSNSNASNQYNGHYDNHSKANNQPTMLNRKFHAIAGFNEHRKKVNNGTNCLYAKNSNTSARNLQSNSNENGNIHDFSYLWEWTEKKTPIKEENKINKAYNNHHKNKSTRDINFSKSNKKHPKHKLVDQVNKMRNTYLMERSTNSYSIDCELRKNWNEKHQREDITPYQVQPNEDISDHFDYQVPHKSNKIKNNTIEYARKYDFGKLANDKNVTGLKKKENVEFFSNDGIVSSMTFKDDTNECLYRKHLPRDSILNENLSHNDSNCKIYDPLPENRENSKDITNESLAIDDLIEWAGSLDISQI